MLSIIICSVNENYLNKIRQNLENTVGNNYELLVWNNREKNLGLSEVYNMMASRAAFPYLCFIHEDIIFQTYHWDKIIIEIFDNHDEIKLVGVAGGRYKSKTISGWFSGIKNMDFYHIVHSNGKTQRALSNKSSWTDSEMQVVNIDGVFMTAKKSAWEKYRFDEKLCKGFHFYDIDFSLRIATYHQVVVTNRIDIVHFSQGDYGNKWIKDAFAFHSKFNHILPVSVDNVNVNEAEMISAKTWLDRLQTAPISLENKMIYIKSQELQKISGMWLPIFKFLSYRPSGAAFVYNSLKKVKRYLKSKL